ncbi:protein NRT1/ PTR FAMILY 4.6-like [Salvia miltiorrhiza]|uniref:protein NRT1/ PTR FAMILY 4.6-like n=1 Tax=Salvia miltiorrhiza TaxID=226208 RepID=UPI0025AC114D|nr:protein NRT1/ PTR FAMILY 4.6-like [Salvia miltiorrhiza]
MEMENQLWEGYVDWRGKAAVRTKHGGMRAAFFVLVVEVLENLAYLANASNLVLYLSQYMHFSPSQAANSVTNFMGTAFLLALLGGFLSDAFFTTYLIYIISAMTEFLGLIILTMQAKSSSLQPPKCGRKLQGETECSQVEGAKAVLLFSGLYLVALGVGGIKGSLPAHGAEQFDGSTPRGRKQRSSFFNYFVFSLAAGSLIAVTLVVWIEDNIGWQWGFGISTLTILLSVPIFLAGSTFYRNKIPRGSPLTTISKVVIGSLVNWCTPRSSSNAVASSPAEEGGGDGSTKKESPSETLKFLNYSAQQVEEVKIVLKVLPIFGCTIVLNCCLAQLSTFSVQQAATMDTNLGPLKLPPASLPVFPVVFIMIIAPLYDHAIVPLARRLTKSEMGISHLQRIGAGLFISVVAMAAAALVETKRRRVAGHHVDSTAPLPLTFLWIAFQYLLLGSADLFTLAGLLEFFFTEAPFSMRSLATSLSFASLAMGYYLSTVIVSVVNGVTAGQPWLAGANLNHYQLHKFYWLMCALSGLNLLHYLFWAAKYKYKSPHTTA